MNLRRFANSNTDAWHREDSELSDAEWEQLRVRVIALEKLVLSLLAESPDPQQVAGADADLAAATDGLIGRSVRSGQSVHKRL